MRKKATPEIAIGASPSTPVKSKALYHLKVKAESFAGDVARAMCAADLAHRHASENGIYDDTKPENEIYFPPHERRVLDFVMHDVLLRLIALDKMADEFSSALSSLHSQIKAAENQSYISEV